VEESQTTKNATMAYTLLTALFVIQLAHMAEHVAQVTQKFILGRPVARGLLGSIFDLEWVHFLYNSWEWVALLLVLIWWRRSGNQVPLALSFVVWFQGYHEIEHIVKMIQYYAYGITVGPKGILGYVFPLIWLHFWLNLIVLFLIAAAFFAVRSQYVRRVPAIA
jgi:hypothetical protein